MTAYDQARLSIDAAHASDPKRTPEGLAAEGVYADRMEAALLRLHPEATPLLRLAARCQHLQRWSVPRASFPLDKVGYHAWRKSLYTKQASQARELLLAAGVPAPEADEVYDWVSKTGLKVNAGTQALEDAACLVFLEFELPGFATLHPDYTRDKYMDIIGKTWRKMSQPAREAALALPLDPGLRSLVGDAIAKLA
jgi:tRNAThr (cytosine32-N3)-methyltransferase